MRAAILVVFLALLVVFAGCASPQDDTGTGGEPAQAESPTTADNDAGAEPVAPPNETNGTESGGTVNPADGDGAGANESSGGESGTNESTANETSGNETGVNETGAGDEASVEPAPVRALPAVGHAVFPG